MQYLNFGDILKYDFKLSNLFLIYNIIILPIMGVKYVFRQIIESVAFTHWSYDWLKHCAAILLGIFPKTFNHYFFAW